MQDVINPHIGANPIATTQHTTVRELTKAKAGKKRLMPTGLPVLSTVVVIKARQPFTLRRDNSQNADWRETALLRHVRVATTAAPTPGYVLPTGYFGWWPEPDKRYRHTTGKRHLVVRPTLARHGDGAFRCG